MWSVYTYTHFLTDLNQRGAERGNENEGQNHFILGYYRIKVCLNCKSLRWILYITQTQENQRVV